MEREGREVEGRRRGGGEMRKGIIMALFLIINVLMISCGNAGPVPKEGQAATADGTLINLKEIGNSIRDAVEFVMGVEEVQTLISSVDEIAKAIGNKINKNGTLEAEGASEKSSQLVAGAFSVILEMSKRVTALKAKTGYDSVKKQVDEIETKTLALIEKIKQDTNLCKDSVTTAHAKEAILRSNPSKTKGAQELDELTTSIGALLKSSKDLLLGKAIKELIEPIKAGVANKAN